MARSRQFMEGWRHAEKSVVTWLLTRARGMADPRARALLNVVADDYGQWARGRYRWNGRPAEVDAGDPLAVFKAAVRDAALEEAVELVEEHLRESTDLSDREAWIRSLTQAIRKVKAGSDDRMKQAMPLR